MSGTYDYSRMALKGFATNIYIYIYICRYTYTYFIGTQDTQGVRLAHTLPSLRLLQTALQEEPKNHVYSTWAGGGGGYVIV